MGYCQRDLPSTAVSSQTFRSTSGTTTLVSSGNTVSFTVLPLTSSSTTIQFNFNAFVSHCRSTNYFQLSADVTRFPIAMIDNTTITSCVLNIMPTVDVTHRIRVYGSVPVVDGVTGGSCPESGQNGTSRWALSNTAFVKIFIPTFSLTSVPRTSGNNPIQLTTFQIIAPINQFPYTINFSYTTEPCQSNICIIHYTKPPLSINYQPKSNLQIKSRISFLQPLRYPVTAAVIINFVDTDILPKDTFDLTTGITTVYYHISDFERTLSVLNQVWGENTYRDVDLQVSLASDNWVYFAILTGSTSFN